VQLPLRRSTLTLEIHGAGRSPSFSRAPEKTWLTPCFACGWKEIEMGILGWILFGLIVGALAKLLMPGKDPGGIVVTILLGIVGALLGGFLGRLLGLYAPGEPAGFLAATLGAILVLALYRMAMRRRCA
jgi:uncharacterized membrane protein YeaQ/YmgE (transglycosylase-associated protein family)